MLRLRRMSSQLAAPGEASQRSSGVPRLTSSGRTRGRRPTLMAHLVRDLQYALRGLVRSPLFTSVALLSLALGIGANTAIFTLVNEVLLRQLPVKDPDQLGLFQAPRHPYRTQPGGHTPS